MTGRPACTAPGVDREWFHADDPDGQAKARAVCAGCPLTGPGGVCDQARDYHGIWGGMDPEEAERSRLGFRQRLIRHGTRSGPNGHRVHGTPLCVECLTVQEVLAAERSAERTRVAA